MSFLTFMDLLNCVAWFHILEFCQFYNFKTGILCRGKMLEGKIKEEFLFECGEGEMSIL